MTYIYKVDKWREVNGEEIPDVEGLDKARWRVLARHPIMSVIESDVELPLEKAPEKWPNGQPVRDKHTIIEWRHGVPAEKDPLDGVPDAVIEKSVRIRALRQTGKTPLRRV